MPEIAESAISPIAALRQQLHEAYLNRQELHEAQMTVLAALPDTSPAPTSITTHARFADAAMHFSGDQALLDQLMAVYPPNAVSLTTADRHQVVPTENVSDETMASSAVIAVHPVVQNTSGIYWWTSRGDLRLQVMFLSEGDVHPWPTENWSPERNAGCKLLPDVRPPMHSTALDRWLAAWSEFAEDVHMRANFKQFWYCFKDETLKDPVRAWDLARLPARHTRARPNEAVTVPSGVPMMDAVETLAAPAPDRPDHAWDRIGDFWTIVPDELTPQLLEFAECQRLALPAAVAAAQADLDTVQAALEAFFADHGLPAAHQRELTLARIRDYVSAKTGLGFELRTLMAHDRDPKVLVEFMFQYKMAYRAPLLAVKPGATLLPQHVPYLAAR